MAHGKVEILICNYNSDIGTCKTFKLYILIKWLTGSCSSLPSITREDHIEYHQQPEQIKISQSKYGFYWMFITFAFTIVKSTNPNSNHCKLRTICTSLNTTFNYSLSLVDSVFLSALLSFSFVSIALATPWKAS